MANEVFMVIWVTSGDWDVIDVSDDDFYGSLEKGRKFVIWN